MKIKSIIFCISLFTLFSCEDQIRTPLNTITVDTSAPKMRASLKAIQSQVFDAKCATSGCHVVNEAYPNLTSGFKLTDLVNVTSPGYDPLLLIKPNDAQNSVMYLKLIGDPSTGGIMPKKSSGFKVSQDEIDSIKAWINAGAPNN